MVPLYAAGRRPDEERAFGYGRAENIASPDGAYLERLRSTARSVPGVVGPADVKAEYIGPEQLHAGAAAGRRPGAPP